MKCKIKIKREHLTSEHIIINTPAGYHVFYGGDLLGVKEKADYLEELGNNVIYFNTKKYVIILIKIQLITNKDNH